MLPAGALCIFTTCGPQICAIIPGGLCNGNGSFPRWSPADVCSSKDPSLAARISGPNDSDSMCSDNSRCNDDGSRLLLTQFDLAQQSISINLDGPITFDDFTKKSSTISHAIVSGNNAKKKRNFGKAFSQIMAIHSVGKQHVNPSMINGGSKGLGHDFLLNPVSLEAILVCPPDVYCKTLLCTTSPTIEGCITATRLSTLLLSPSGVKRITVTHLTTQVRMKATAPKCWQTNASTDIKTRSPTRERKQRNRSHMVFYYSEIITEKRGGSPWAKPRGAPELFYTTIDRCLLPFPIIVSICPI
eukprot:Gb_03813 [translate_table: standard]